MNLVEQRAMVGSILDFDPDVQTYKNEVTSILNQLYVDFFTDKKWKFAQKTLEITAYADATATDGGISASPNITTASPFFLSWMEGQIIEVGGTAPVADRGEFIVRSVHSTTSATLIGYTASGVTANVTFTAKHRYIDLPHDHVSTLSAGVRDIAANTLPYANLSRHLEEEMDLLFSRVGRATDWIAHDDFTMPHPIAAPTLSAVAGSIPAGTYEVCYTFVTANRESNYSPATSITLAAPGGISVTSMQNTGADSGLYKRFYIKTPDSQAFWAAASPDVAETVTAVASLAFSTSYLTSSVRRPEHGGNYQRFRLYPRQDTDTKVQLRYLYRPPLMLDDTDVPEYPSSHHLYLVYRACEQLFIKHNNTAHSQLYRQKADKELLKLGNRFLSEGSAHWVKGSFGTKRPFGRVESPLIHNG